MAFGCLLAGVSIFGVARLLEPHPSFAGLAAVLAVVGFGLGLALVAVSAAVLAVVPPERSGMGASTLNTSRELGGVLAVAILGAVVNGRLIAELERKLNALDVPQRFHSLIINAVTHGGVPANATEAAASNPVVAANIGLVARVLSAAEAAFGHALHVALAVTAVILLAGAVIAAATTRTVRSA